MSQPGQEASRRPNTALKTLPKAENVAGTVNGSISSSTSTPLPSSSTSSEGFAVPDVVPAKRLRSDALPTVGEVIQLDDDKPEAMSSGTVRLDFEKAMAATDGVLASLTQLSSSENAAVGQAASRSSPDVPAGAPTPIGLNVIADKFTGVKVVVLPGERDRLPLCFCASDRDGTMLIDPDGDEPIRHCQALSTIDGELVSCNGEVNVDERGKVAVFRGSSRAEYRALCLSHYNLFRLHYACGFCGHFCTKGTFRECSVAARRHYSHRECGWSDGSEECPHCGDTQSQGTGYVNVQDFPPSTISEGGNSGARLSVADGRKRRQLVKHLIKAQIPLPTLRPEDRPRLLEELGEKGTPEYTRLESTVLNVERGWHPTHLDVNPNAALSAAVKACDVLATFYWLSKGSADPNSASLIHQAALDKSLLLVYVLAAAGADVNALAKGLGDEWEELPPVAIAVHADATAVIHVLLTFQADPSLPFQYRAGDDGQKTDGTTALHVAGLLGHNDAAHALASCPRTKVNAQDDGGWTPLSWATEHARADTALLLLSRGAKPMLKDMEGNVCLHWAAYSGSVQIAHKLLEISGPRALEEQNIYGDSPLHVAAREKKWDVLVLFLSNDVRLDVNNNNHESPLSILNAANREEALPANVKAALQLNHAQRRNAKRPAHRIIHTDLSRGREKLPVPVVNEVDTDKLPPDFKYVVGLVDTPSVRVDRHLPDFRYCECGDDCSSGNCSCAAASEMGDAKPIGGVYGRDMRLMPDMDVTLADSVMECNAACACTITTCRNRVAQRGLT